MSHQCVHCGRIIPSGSNEILRGCSSCGSHFFVYIKEEDLKNELEELPLRNTTSQEKRKIEKEIREISGITEEDKPVILNLESIRALEEGKFEIDLVHLLNKNRPLIYKIEEGKYFIDIAPPKKWKLNGKKS